MITLFLLFQLVITGILAVVQFCIWTIGLLAKGILCLLLAIPGEVKSLKEKRGG